MKITREFLFAIAPGASEQIVAGIIASADRIAAKITNPVELAYFMGQNAAETQGFTRIEENLKYLSVERLRAVWPGRFRTDASAAPFVRNPQALANHVYGGRYGNRPGTNDGWNYRGSGLNQTTFRDNYAAVEAATGVRCVENADLLRSFPSAVDAAVVYWVNRNLGRFAASGDLIGLTKAIQGADGGLRDRKTFTDRAIAFTKRQPSTAAKGAQSTPRSDWLRTGSSGPAVTSLQTKLKLAGFYKGGVLDGDFGDGTDLAVREFQKANGLIVDGVVGEKTLAALDKAAGGATTPGTPQKPVGEARNGLAAIIAALIGVLVKLFSRRGSKDGKE